MYECYFSSNGRTIQGNFPYSDVFQMKYISTPIIDSADNSSPKGNTQAFHTEFHFLNTNSPSFHALSER